MTKIEIFNTGYAWDWLHALNKFLDGASWGAGFVLVFILFVMYMERLSKKREANNEKDLKELQEEQNEATTRHDARQV